MGSVRPAGSPTRRWTREGEGGGRREGRCRRVGKRRLLTSSSCGLSSTAPSSPSSRSSRR
eukprot:scaffold11869_cov30-Tisochrysis_lutea.AAC.9